MKRRDKGGKKKQEKKKKENNSLTIHCRTIVWPEKATSTYVLDQKDLCTALAMILHESKRHVGKVFTSMPLSSVYFSILFSLHFLVFFLIFPSGVSFCWSGVAIRS